MNDLAEVAGAGAASMILRESLQLPAQYVAPSTEMESKIASAFSRALRVEPVGVYDEFYDLGGDSLTGEQLSMEIELVTGRPFALSQLFEFSTPRSIANLLTGAAPSQHETGIIFLVHGRGGYTAPRPEFRKAIASGRRLHTFELPGIRGDGPRVRHIADLAATYVQQIQDAQPTGPVRLASFCAGGLIALEMAAQLQDLGRQLDRIVLVDPRLPNRVNRRYRAERQLSSSRPGLLSTLRYFRATGRLPGSPFLEPVFTELEFRWAERVELRRIARDRRNGVSFAKRHDGVGLKDEPRAALIAAYRFAWPRPFDGTVYILASRDRYKTFSDSNKAWDWLAPRRVVEIATEKHSEIGNAAGGTVPKRMDEILI